MRPEPFTLHIEQSKLDDLRERLVRTRWPDLPSDTGWSYGTELTFMKRLVSHWSTKFDWRAQEAKLNQFPQFTVKIGDIDLHYLHVLAKGGQGRPLLLSHGWPGSIFEFMDLIPRLTDPERFGGSSDDAFTVVAPCLPGYGLSFKPGQRLVISLYWLTGTIGSSFAPYHDRMHDPATIDRPVVAPMGYCEFPGEIVRPPRSFAERTYSNIKRWTVMERGGHFAAMEQPDALAEDIRRFFRELATQIG